MSLRVTLPDHLQINAAAKHTGQRAGDSYCPHFSIAIGFAEAA